MNAAPAQPPAAAGSAWEAIRRAYRADETQCVHALLDALPLDAATRHRIDARAIELVERMRSGHQRFGGMDQLLQEFSLSSNEGVVLMCLAEALLRVPDTETLDRFISDKLGIADWERHLSPGKPLFVNAATWMLMFTGKVVRRDDEPGQRASQLERLVARLGRPLIRQALLRAMRILGSQFILGRSIDEALQAAAGEEQKHYRHSFDMLGESARGAPDARGFFDAYAHAIERIGMHALGADPAAAPGISVKLSALHPRYEFGQRARAMRELTPRLLELALRAKDAGIGLTVDAEEADRLELSLQIFASVCREPGLAGWDGLGLAVQAYQKRAPQVIAWLHELALDSRHLLRVRLVKGAYWDSEIKRAQERGLDGYPVYTRKASTDLSYLVCARRLLAARDVLYGQFATHNAHTVAAIIELAGERRDYEFQRLHGMGEALYAQIVGPASTYDLPCRVYAPVGDHENLLAYLVRRLLENGANTSFVNRIADALRPAAEVVADPLQIIAGLPRIPHPGIALPRDLYRPERLNSSSIDLSDPCQVDPLLRAIQAAARRDWSAGPLIGGVRRTGPARAASDPADRRRTLGEVVDASGQDADAALQSATAAAPAWDALGVEERAHHLDRMAGMLEQHRESLLALAVREAGKTIPDALAEVREAVDFCRYYAARARLDLGARELRGPTGEHNELQWHGRGVWISISPWNFPLAIFTGQIAAALAAGNCVIAKPAEQTALIAALAVELFHRAGIPPDVLHLLPGPGAAIGGRLIADERTAGVAFTGSVDTALRINRALAQRRGPIVPLIAETGGQNAMIVDSTALPEQVVDDVLASSFRSAGQRCSALRVLFVQDEVAERIVSLLVQAADELAIGDPGDLATDVGPVIDEEALARLDAHAKRMAGCARTLYVAGLGAASAHGSFFAPRIFEIDSLDQIPEEVFGPILHVIRYPAHALDQVIEAINASRYGLTLGIQTRIDSKARAIQSRLRVGNAYVNRNTIGAVVGVQPFGGEGLSGTGPKAGGPHYLYRFALERVLTINTAATGGNAALASLSD